MYYRCMNYMCNTHKNITHVLLVYHTCNTHVAYLVVYIWQYKVFQHKVATVFFVS